MRAVLVGRIEDDNLYYDIDASTDEKDGILVRPDNSMVKVDFFDFAGSCAGLLKIKTSKFHKFLWNGIKRPGWENIFANKTKPINEAMLQGIEIYQSLGKNKKKLDKTNKKASEFKKTVNKQKPKKNMPQKIKTKSAQPCCDNEMVKFDMSNLVFKSAQTRKEAWTAMVLLRQLEE